MEFKKFPEVLKWTALYIIGECINMKETVEITVGEFSGRMQKYMHSLWLYENSGPILYPLYGVSEYP